MQLLRPEQMLVQHDLLVALRGAADQHGAAADALADGPLAGAPRTLAGRRTALADRLAEAVGQAGDVPDAPPRETALLRSVGAQFKAILAGAGTAAVLADCRAAERQVAATAVQAAAHPLSPGLATAGAGVAEDARGHIDALAAAHGIELPPE